MNTTQKLNVKIVINSGFKNNALNTHFYHNMIIKDIILLSLKTFQESDLRKLDSYKAPFIKDF